VGLPLNHPQLPHRFSIFPLSEHKGAAAGLDTGLWS
jgi:hypothetical protein